VVVPALVEVDLVRPDRRGESPFFKNSAEPEISIGPVYSVPIAQWALSRWWAPQPVIISF
jgi:hypothetical protein